MRRVYFALAAHFLWFSTVLAGSNGGGTLLVHALEVAFTTDNSGYCDQPIPRNCENVRPRIDGGASHVWMVVAAFTAQNKPRLMGVEFGISYSGIGIVDFGTCAQVESAMPSWPQSGSGTMVTWPVPRLERLVPVYWFAGYAYAAADEIQFRVAPHPVNGGHFADDYAPAHLDEIAAYGALGFDADGSAPCPSVGTIVVRPDGTGDRPTIQAAINVAAPTSVIELEDGVYRGPGNRDIKPRDTYLTIRSRSGNPRACVIDCEGDSIENHRGFFVDHDERSQPIIEGITITGGYAGKDFAYDAEGAAVKLQPHSALMMRNCIFENCTAEDAGGAVETWGRIVLEDCTFIGNSSRHRRGGAIWAVMYPLTLRRCRFEGNVAALSGGAIGAAEVPVALEACVFVDNAAPEGGAAWFNRTQTNVVDCTWSDNAANNGGAVYCIGGAISIAYSTFSDNRSVSGSSLYCGDPACAVDLRNTIFSFGLGGGAMHCGTASVMASGCDMFGTEGGDWPSCLIDVSQTNANFSADPLYCAREQRNYFLNASSPCAEWSNPDRGLVGAWPVGCGDVTLVPPTDLPAVHNTFPVLRATVSPNPSRDDAVIRVVALGGSSQPPRIGIFDTAGRMISSVAAARGAPGQYNAVWDGRDPLGRQVPSGMYFVRLASGNQERSVPVIRLR